LATPGVIRSATLFAMLCRLSISLKLLAEVGAYGVNFHDNDLVPIDAAARNVTGIVKEFRVACDGSGSRCLWRPVNLFYDPVFRDGAFTANNADVRAYALQKTMRAMDLGAEFGAHVFVLWGGRRRRRNRRLSPAGRGDQAISRSGELPLRIQHRSKYDTNSHLKQSPTSRVPISISRRPLHILRSSVA
jgi:xylose isomerase